MNRRNQWLLSGALATVMVVGAFACILLFQLSGTVKSVEMAANGTIANINRPCKGSAGPDACGTLAQINKVAIAAGDVANASAMQVMQGGALIKATTRNIDSIGTSLTGTATRLDATVDTLNAQLPHLGPAIDAARDAAASVAPIMQGVTPILANADGAVTDIRHFITAPSLTGTVTNVDNMTASWAAISANGQKITDKMTADYFKPVPWYMYPVKKGSELLDIGAAVARHTP